MPHRVPFVEEQLLLVERDAVPYDEPGKVHLATKAAPMGTQTLTHDIVVSNCGRIRQRALDSFFVVSASNQFRQRFDRWEIVIT